jgi:elongator complex protein 2
MYYYIYWILFILDFESFEGSKQALGLMTKKNIIEADEDDENADFNNFQPDGVLTNTAKNNYMKTNYSEVPDEDYLTNYTLWPESNKLYGHGYEIICLAISHNGKYIASAGKAQSDKHSKLFLWDSQKNQLICKLDGHALTIVQTEFSADDEYLLTVSRDRSFCLFRRNTCDNGEKQPYVLMQTEKETHMRIIWTCSWSHDSSLFVTGSRDNSIKIWTKNNTNNLFTEVFKKEFKSAVTSVNILPEIYLKIDYIIVGLESGDLILLKYERDSRKEEVVYVFPEYLSHGGTVKRIKSVRVGEVIRLATCSSDNSVRIFEIEIDKLK